MAKVDWNAGEYESSRGYEVLPKGRYLVMVNDTEMKPTKNKDGKYIEVEFVVLRPENAKNRKLWARLNVFNPSEQAQRIGREQFNALVEACGFPKGSVEDTAKLHDKILTVIVDIEKGQSGETNRVTGFISSDAATNPAAQKLAKELRETSAKSDKGAGSGKTSRREPPPPMDDDDIPF